MGAMDEKIPGLPGATSAGMGLPPQIMAMIQQMVASKAAPSLAAKQSEIIPGSPGGLLPASAPPNVGGMMPLPSGGMVAPNQAQAQYPGPHPGAGQGPQPDMSQSFATKGQRDTFLVQSAIQGVGEGVKAYKQKKFEEESNQTSQAWQNYLYFKQGADKGDPKMKQMMDQMMQDPKIHKLFDKAQKDLGDGKMSGAAVGLQKAIKSSQDQAATQMQFDELQAKIANQKAQQQEAMAKASQAQALTPREGHERNVAMGTEASADIIEKTKEREAEQKQADEFRRDKLKQDAQIAADRDQVARERMQDTRATAQDRIAAMRESAAAKNEIAMMRLDQQQQAREGKSMVPAPIQRWVDQAIMVKEQAEKLEKLVDDPEVSKYMGPVKGSAIPKWINQRTSDKFAEFVTSNESMMGLQGGIHGRYSTAMHTLFAQASSGSSASPKAYKGAISGLKGLSDRIINEVRRQYPNDILFKGYEDSGQLEPRKSVAPDLDEKGNPKTKTSPEGEPKLSPDEQKLFNTLNGIK
jgi:hypothetical protein